MQARRGDVAAAVPLAERALALLGEGQDARNLALLRGEVGRLQLELDPPALDEARHNLEQAAAEMEWSPSTSSDRAQVILGLARAAFLSGDVPASRDLVAQVHAVSNGQLPLAEAEAWAARIAGPAYVTDSQTAIAVVDGVVYVVSEGEWRFFASPRPGAPPDTSASPAEATP